MWRVSYLLSGVDQACHTTGKLVFVILENNWPEQKTPQQEGFARFGRFARSALRPGVNAAWFFHGVTRSNDVTSPFTPKKRSPPVWTRPKQWCSRNFFFQCKPFLIWRTVCVCVCVSVNEWGKYSEPLPGQLIFLSLIFTAQAEVCASLSRAFLVFHTL